MIGKGWRGMRTGGREGIYMSCYKALEGLCRGHLKIVLYYAERSNRGILLACVRVCMTHVLLVCLQVCTRVCVCVCK